MLAKVVFFGPDKGGRHSPPKPGCRPQLNFGDVQTSCVIGEGEAVDQYDFDVEHLVSLRLIFADVYGDRVYSGASFSLCEGSRLVGTATIA